MLNKSQILEFFNNNNIKMDIQEQTLVEKIISLSEIYRILISIEDPIKRKICEVLTARNYKKQLPINALRDIKKSLIKSLDEIKNNRNLTNICLFLIAREANKEKIYSGVNTIIKISSFVIKDLFEILDQIFKKYFNWQLTQFGSIYDYPEINFKIQNEAIHNYSQVKYKEKLIKNTKYGKILFRFINTIIKLLYDQFNIRASYDNGRTGFALSKLEDFLSLKRLNFINDALANSYIISKDISKGYSQEYQKKSEYAFYLNRLICVYYNLPIKYGGYRVLDYNQIKNYIIKGKLPPEKRFKESLLDYINFEEN